MSDYWRRILVLIWNKSLKPLNLLNILKLLKPTTEGKVTEQFWGLRRLRRLRALRSLRRLRKLRSVRFHTTQEVVHMVR